MLPLKTLQQAFSQAVYDKDVAALSRAVLPSHIANEDRIRVYQDNVLINLYNSLKNKYPNICKLVDERFFRYAVDEYLKLYRPASGDLDMFGESFCDFIGHFPPAKNVPYLADIARLEWELHRAYFAADHDPLDRKQLAAIAPEQLGDVRFILHPSVSIIVSRYPIDRIWAFVQGEGEEAVDLETGGADMLVVRLEFVIHHYTLEKGEAPFLRHLQQGENLYAAYEAASCEREDFDIGQALQRWVERGVLCGIA